ncbi:phosphohistidine phosphatase SixA [Pseudomonas sp. GD03721]|nr:MULTISPECIES: phosphohistidine phosphatase SixA [Pseudomonas]MDH1443810.1 phosphohistidine phosphatase SixA [Pseudomonas sp. GD03722]MDV5861700.1 phosphohistidine phosphatase SixA [Pseudomonas mendocina]WGF99965.1 phosphohistidine phosphatase SixA [Pseudomonas sp. GD03721]WGG04130.1 phosphohistidine phosphatase SixA [Pseudomonas sp. GD03919]
MRLWLLRHGQAEPQAASDAARELTAHGRQEVQQAAAQLLGRPLTAIMASPYVRAQQTAELVRLELGFSGSVQTVSWLTPDSDPRDALKYLDEREHAEVLLVSHQPLIGALGGLLVHGHRQEPLPMRTASLAELEGDISAAGLMELLALIHPR